MRIKKCFVNGGCWASTFRITCRIKNVAEIIPFRSPIAGFRIMLK